MTSTANSRFLPAFLMLGLGVCSCAKSPPAPVAAPTTATAAAGVVEAVEGKVTAQRGLATTPLRVLALRDPIWADDTVVTGDQASVSIRLAHNHVLWLLQGGQTRRVDAAAAWRAPAETATVALADHLQAPATASAGRHSEQEAAQTGEAATRPAPAAVPAALADAGADAEKKKESDEHRKRVVEAVQKEGLLRIIGSKGKDDDALKDVLSGGNQGIAENSALFGHTGDGAPLALPPRTRAKARSGGGGISGIGIGEGGGGGSGLGIGKGGGGSGMGTDPRLVTNVTLDPQVLSGTVNPASLSRFLTQVRARMRVAYERALKSNVGLGGFVVVRVAVANGAVTSVTVESKDVEPALANCVTTPLRAAKMPDVDACELRITVRLDSKD